MRSWLSQSFLHLSIFILKYRSSYASFLLEPFSGFQLPGRQKVKPWTCFQGSAESASAQLTSYPTAPYPSRVIKKDRCLERLKAGGEGGNRGWDGWMASPTRWTWVWANSRKQWRTGKPGVLQSMGLQIVEQSLATGKQQWLNKDVSNFLVSQIFQVPLFISG